MKDKLLKVYQDRQAEFKEILTDNEGENLGGPILMSPNEKYDKQPNPLLIVGQETSGWTCYVDDLRKQMDVYENFNLGENYYSSPFWNVTRKIEKALGNEPYSCAYTNINKFDHDGGRPRGGYEREIASLDDILVTEIKIIQPKVCIFFTGHSFDSRIRNIFPEVEFANIEGWGWKPKQLSHLKHPGLPFLTFRTYHPRYLRQKRLETDFIEFLTGYSNYIGSS
jgi:hypothetical protein